jgi:hypothetical protein
MTTPEMNTAAGAGAASPVIIQSRRPEQDEAESEDQKIQQELDTLMAVLEDIQKEIPEGAYLRGMNALGALHRHKCTHLIQRQQQQQQRRRGSDMLNCWATLEEIEESDEDLYDEIMSVADDIVIEICGNDSSIFMDASYNLVHRGEEREIFQLLASYKPEEGNAGYETSPMVLHHAIQVIMSRLFEDTIHELDIVRPVSCQCGWRGTQGNWDRHLTNSRHLRWVVAERALKMERRLTKARELVVARREPGLVYLNELNSTAESRIAIAEAVHAAEMNGDRVIFVRADGENMSWFA